MFENLERNKQSLQSKFYFNYNTSNSNWFRAGGNAKVFIIVENSNELVKIIKLLKGINYLSKSQDRFSNVFLNLKYVKFIN